MGKSNLPDNDCVTERERGKTFSPLPEIKQHKNTVAEPPFSTLPVSVKKNDLKYSCSKANSGGKKSSFLKAKSLPAISQRLVVSVFISLQFYH